MSATNSGARLGIVVAIVSCWSCGDKRSDQPPIKDDNIRLTVDPDAVAATQWHPIMPAPPLTQISIPAGAGVDPELRCAPFQRPQKTVARFLIDSRPAAPEEYDLCVEAGACPPSTQKAYWRTSLRESSVTSDGAIAFCNWRHGSLPAYGQWQLAMRTARDVEEHAPCEHPLHAGIAENCIHVAASGATYRLRNANYGEWLRDRDCSDGRFKPVALDLSADDSIVVTDLLEEFAVRCAFAAQR